MLEIINRLRSNLSKREHAHTTNEKRSKTSFDDPKSERVKTDWDYAFCYAIVKIETNLIVIRCKIKKKKKDPIVDFPLEICKFVCARTRVLFFSFFFFRSIDKNSRTHEPWRSRVPHDMRFPPRGKRDRQGLRSFEQGTSRCYDIIYVYICIQHTHEYIINN